MSVSLQKDFISCFHIYFPASFASYFLVLDTYSQTSAMVSFNVETLNSGANPPLWNSFIRFDYSHSHLRESAKDGSSK